MQRLRALIASHRRSLDTRRRTTKLEHLAMIARPAAALRLTVLLALIGCFPFMPLTCHAPDLSQQGQYGSYTGPFMLIRLPSGDTFTVYRVKCWRFREESRALQIEYQTRVPILDTTQVKREAAQIWSVFRPYVEQSTLTSAILTATHREVQRNGAAYLSRMRSFGVILARDSSGDWQRKGETMPLPAPARIEDSDANGVGIFERDGKPLGFSPEFRRVCQSPA